jgi:hypothetical protein
MSKYYTPMLEEFQIGFEFESNAWLFSEDGEWTKGEITKDNIENFTSLYKADFYPTEFRKLKL